MRSNQTGNGKLPGNIARGTYWGKRETGANLLVLVITVKAHRRLPAIIAIDTETSGVTGSCVGLILTGSLSKSALQKIFISD